MLEVLETPEMIEHQNGHDFTIRHLMFAVAAFNPIFSDRGFVFLDILGIFFTKLIGKIKYFSNFVFGKQAHICCNLLIIKHKYTKYTPVYQTFRRLPYPKLRLLRWAESEGKSTIDELNKASRGLWIFRKGIESQETGENGYPMDPSSAGYYTPKFQTFTMPYSYYLRVFNNARYYFAPFSTTTLKDYKQLQQNPGWTNFNYNN